MVKTSYINFTELQVTQFEFFADTLEDIVNSKEGVEKKLMILILNIESLLPNSNIYDYVVKKDIHKAELEYIDQKMWELKNRLSEIYNDIDDSEWKVESDSNEEFVFNKIKEKLIDKKGLNYGNI